MELAFLHRRIDHCCHRVDPGDDEPVLVRHPAEVLPDVCIVPDPVPVRRFEFIEDHVGEREAVHVPEDIDRTVDRADTFPVELQVVPGGGGREHVEAEDIDPDLCDDLCGCHHIAEAF